MTAGRVRIGRIPDTGTQALTSFLQDVVEPGSIIVTDGWPPYKNVRRLGYVHAPHNVS